MAYETVLLVLDMQRDFCEPEGAYARNGVDVSAAAALVPRVARLMEAGKAAGLATLATKFTVLCAPDGRPVGIDHILKLRPFLGREGFREGDPGREIARGLPRPDYAVDKMRFSAFHSSTLEVLLRSLGARRIACAGIATHIGVESTVRDALARDFEVLVLRDAVGAFDPKLHKASLAVMASFARVVSSEEFLREIAG